MANESDTSSIDKVTASLEEWGGVESTEQHEGSQLEPVDAERFKFDLSEIEPTSEIDPYKTSEYLRLLRAHNSKLLSYDLRGEFGDRPGVTLSSDGKDFAKNITQLADEVGKEAADRIGLLIVEADAELLGIAEQYGGMMITAEGDGRRIFFPSLPGEDLAETARRGVFVANQFQEATKTLPPIRFKDRSVDLVFRGGVDCTDKETGNLVVTSFGDDYLRTFAVFGDVIAQADAVQREADPDKRQVAVSKSIRSLLSPKSYFKETESGNYVLSALHAEDKPLPVVLSLLEDEANIPIEDLTHFYEAHIPTDRRAEMRAAVTIALEEGRPVEFSPAWEFLRVSTAFTKVHGLHRRVAQLNNGESNQQLHERLNKPFTDILHIVDRNGGSVERITGEGVVYSTFAGPSNEYLATRATFESGKILNQAGFMFEAGISTDYAFAGEAGAKDQHTFTNIGKRVNEAARIMQSAKENHVVISGTTHRGASHRLRCGEREELELKGVGSVEVFVVNRIDYRAGRYAEVEKIVGRDKEESQVGQLVDFAIETGKSQVLVVEGEQGVGKTAIVSKAIAHDLEAGKIYKIDVRSDESNRKLPLSTAKQFVRQLLDIPDDIEDPKDLEARILSRELPADIIERISLLNAVLDTDFKPTTERVQWLERSARREETLKLMRDIFQLKRQSMAHEVPVIFADDWQFIDKQSADLLVGFMRETANDGIVWAIPTRPAVNDIERVIINGLKHNLPEQTHQLDVEPFPMFVPPPDPGEKATDAAARKDYYLKLRNAQITWFEQNSEWAWPLVCSVFPMDEGELSRNKLGAAKVISRVFSKDVSHGNIYYVREVLSYLSMIHDIEIAGRGGKKLPVVMFVAHPDTGRWHFADYTLPGEDKEQVKNSRFYYLGDEDVEKALWERFGGIVDIQKKRMERVSSNSQVVAQKMSILGLECTKPMLLRLTRMSERRLDICLDELIEYGIAQDLDNGNFGFIHRITQEVIYGSIANVEEKRATHETILAILEAEYPNKYEKLSSKFFHAKNGSDLLKIMEYADLYGRQLRDYVEESGAISVLERGSQAFVELEKQGFPGVDEQQKWQLINEQLERLLFIRFIWNQLSRGIDEVTTLESAHEIFHRYYGGEDGRETYPAAWAAYHSRILSDLGLRVGDKEPERAAREYYEVALDMLKPFEQEAALNELPDDLRQLIIINLSNTYRRLGVYYRRMDGIDNLTKARDLAERAVSYARMANNYDTTTSAVNGLGIVSRQLGNWEVANRCYEECLSLAEGAGNLPDQAAYLGNQAEVMRGLGDIDGAEASFTRSLDITSRVFRPRTRAWSQLGLGSLNMAIGNFPRAVDHLKDAKEFFMNTNILVADGLSIDLAHCLLRLDRPDTLSAGAELSSVRSDDARLGMINVYITAYADYLDKYISLEDFIKVISTQAEAFLSVGMNSSAMDAYRFMGEITTSLDPTRSRSSLLLALKLSDKCRAGVDKKMIAAKLQS